MEPPHPAHKSTRRPKPRILRAKDFRVFNFSFLRSRASALGIASSTDHLELKTYNFPPTSLPVAFFSLGRAVELLPQTSASVPASATPASVLVLSAAPRPHPRRISRGSLSSHHALYE